MTIWYVDMSDEELAKETAKDRSIWLDKKELRGEKEKTMGKVKEVMLGVEEDVVVDVLVVADATGPSIILLKA